MDKQKFSLKFIVTIMATVKPDYMKQLVQHAFKERSKGSSDAPKHLEEFQRFICESTFVNRK